MSQALLANVRLRDFRPVTRRLALVSGDPLVLDPTAPRSLTEAFLDTVRRFPGRQIRFIGTQHQRELSYARLFQKALRVAAGLEKQGLRPGDRAILQLDTLRGHYIAF